MSCDVLPVAMYSSLILVVSLAHSNLLGGLKGRIIMNTKIQILIEMYFLCCDALIIIGALIITKTSAFDANLLID